jgi:hypothetical protein
MAWEKIKSHFDERRELLVMAGETGSCLAAKYAGKSVGDPFSKSQANH